MYALVVKNEAGEWSDDFEGSENAYFCTLEEAEKAAKHYEREYPGIEMRIEKINN